MENEITSISGLIDIIETAKNNALKKVNAELIQMYWRVGEYLSQSANNTAFSNAYMDSIAKEVQQAFPGIFYFYKPFSWWS